jgi:carbon-monoxide dehydrogenase medium subunit
MTKAEEALEGQPISDATIDVATDIAQQAAEPAADVQADVAYKRDLVKSLGARVLRIARDRTA